MTTDISLRLFPLDKERFGIESARTFFLSIADLEKAEVFVKDNQVKFLVARVPTNELRLVQEMEYRGYLLTDTLVYYKFDLEKKAIPLDSGKIPIRSLKPFDEVAVREIAMESFKGYYGHYHADKRLDPVKCDETYSDWAARSCVDKKLADEVLIAELDGRVAGFATLRYNSDQEGEGVLFGVAPFAQGKGVYRSFIIRSLQWFKDHGRSSMVVSTQVTNIPVQKVWARCGFEMDHSFYTLHKWF